MTSESTQFLNGKLVFAHPAPRDELGRLLCKGCCFHPAQSGKCPKTSAGRRMCGNNASLNPIIWVLADKLPAPTRNEL